jgi:hypothetical protein
MNFRYFACPSCKKFTSAGYRWAYWHLEHPGLVEPNKPVDIRALLDASDYWQPPLESDSAWLYEEVFPLVKAFLSEHSGHRIIFVESGDFFDREDFDSWVEIEKC